MPNMSEKNVSCDLVAEAERIVLENQIKPGEKSFASVVFGRLLDDKKARVPLEANEMRTLELRDQCVEIIRLINYLLLGKPELEEETINKLKLKLRILEDAGITVDDHRGQDPEMFLNNPLRIAVYASSKLFTTIQENICSTDGMGRLSLLPSTHAAVVVLSVAKHVNRFIGEEMGTMTEAIPNH